jgi:hypothetical protein
MADDEPTIVRVRAEDVAEAPPGRPRAPVLEQLATPDEEGLIRVRAGNGGPRVPVLRGADILAVEFRRGRGEGCACGAIDAPGRAPMLGEPAPGRRPAGDCSPGPAAWPRP